MQTDRFFSAEERAEIERRVRRAETASGGEIVVLAVDASDPYPEALWTAAALGAVALPLAAALLHRLAGLWAGDWLLWVAAPALLGAALGWLAAQVPAVRRGLVAETVIERRTGLRAAAAFVSEEVFATRDRTGVLLFLSLFERRVVVLGDSGIDARVPAGAWDTIVAGVVAGIRAGRPGEAVAEAVDACGRLLAERGVERRADDVDELADGLRREEL